MGSLAILADDLTGALDSAAPFATRESAVRVAWQADALGRADRSALDTESRNIAARTAAVRVRASLRRLSEVDIGFKKIDSLIRGNTLAELAACAASGDFGSIVIAPAFPEQGRITRCGTQIVPGFDGVPSALDVAGELTRRGVPVQRVGRFDVLPSGGVMLCDAETGPDLARIALAGGYLRTPVLWCGTAGLARAMGRPRATPPAGDGPRLVVIGSHNPTAVAQAARLSAHLGAAAMAVTSDDSSKAAVAAIARNLGAGGSSALHFALPPAEPAGAEALMNATFRRLARMAPPAVLVVVGGDTLYRLCRAIRAECLLATGEWTPGVPVARIVGGDWDGVQLLSKSGAFGDCETLVGLLDTKTEPTCA